MTGYQVLFLTTTEKTLVQNRSLNGCKRLKMILVLYFVVQPHPLSAVTCPTLKT